MVGIPTGASRAAPTFEKLRTVQSMALPLNSMFPAFKTRCRVPYAFRLSSVSSCHFIPILPTSPVEPVDEGSDI